MAEYWIDLGPTEDLAKMPLQQVNAKNRDFAVSFKDGEVGVVSNVLINAIGPG